MRDWIGTGVSLLGLIVLVTGLLQLVRMRRAHAPRPRPGNAAYAGPVGMVLVALGQLIVDRPWPTKVPHVVVVALAVTAMVLQYRRTRRLPR